MKKQCCQLSKTKSFKERNPDLDMDEIQNNPHIPDDVKEVLNDALTLAADDEEELDGDANIPPGDDTDFVIVKRTEEVILENNYDPFDDSDEDQINQKNGRRRKITDYDDDWFSKHHKRKPTKKKEKKSKKEKDQKKKNDTATVTMTTSMITTDNDETIATNVSPSNSNGVAKIVKVKREKRLNDGKCLRCLGCK